MTKTRWICDCGEIQDWYRPFCPDCNRSRRNNYNTKEKKRIVPRKPTTKILARLDRYDEILRLRNEEKLKYREIATKLGITHQRVQQILKDQFPDGFLKRLPKKLFTVICDGCGISFQISKSSFNAKGIKHRFHSKDCRRAYFYKSPEQKRKAHNERCKKYYNNILKLRSNWKEIIKKRNQKAIQEGYYKKYYKMKLEKDPDYYKKVWIKHKEKELLKQQIQKNQ